MRTKLVTLDVSKLSGWLNADDPYETSNIAPMSVTLDVSKLSGWLNADARANMPPMFVTCATSQSRGWSKLEAPCQVWRGRGEDC